MVRYRYFLWTQVWELLQTIDAREVVPPEKWGNLHDLLDLLWQDERKDALPGELGAHAGVWSKLKKQ